MVVRGAAPGSDHLARPPPSSLSVLSTFPKTRYTLNSTASQAQILSQISMETLSGHSNDSLTKISARGTHRRPPTGFGPGEESLHDCQTDPYLPLRSRGDLTESERVLVNQHGHSFRSSGFLQVTVDRARRIEGRDSC